MARKQNSGQGTQKWGKNHKKVSEQKKYERGDGDGEGMENDMGGESKTEKGVEGKDSSKGGDGEALKTCRRHTTEGKNHLRENSAEYRRCLLERVLTSRGSQPKMAWKPSSRNFDSTTNTTTLELWYVPKRTPVVFSSNNNDDWVTSEDMWSDKFKNS